MDTEPSNVCPSQTCCQETPDLIRTFSVETQQTAPLEKCPIYDQTSRREGAAGLEGFVCQGQGLGNDPVGEMEEVKCGH